MIKDSQTHMYKQLAQAEVCSCQPIIVNGMAAYKFFRADLTQNKR